MRDPLVSISPPPLKLPNHFFNIVYQCCLQLHPPSFLNNQVRKISTYSPGTLSLGQCVGKVSAYIIVVSKYNFWAGKYFDTSSEAVMH